MHQPAMPANKATRKTTQLMKNGERIMNSIGKIPTSIRVGTGASTHGASARAHTRAHARPRVPASTYARTCAPARGGTLVRARTRGTRIRAHAFILAFALLLALAACLLAGCSGSSSDVPGHYTISEQSINASGASNPQDVVIVTAASQGQAFKLPVSALSHAMAAIESESYVGYLVPDGSDLRGKVYAGTKNSERAKQDELSSFKADYLCAACDARDITGSIDLLAALNKAAGQLNARSGDGAKTICVVSSGLANTGLLTISQELLAADPQGVVEQLRTIGAIWDYRDITVIFYGLGQSTGNQAIPASAKKSLENLYAGIVRAGGGEAVVATDALEVLGCDEELPDTGIVDLRADSLDIPALAKGESTQIVLDSAVLTFKGDSAEYADEAQSANVLGEIAQVAMSGGYKVVVEGYTADSPSRSDEFLKALSQNRANAVADSLSSLGVPAGNITATGCGSEGSSSMASGSFNESQAQVDRRVVITLANAG